MSAVFSTPIQSSDLTGRQLGRYEVLSQLASGGMATVYVARRGGIAGFERLVAIKVLHPHLAHDEEFISMFLDEARLAARIRNPNVVATLDISDTQGDGYFLVMEYVEGDHLGNLLRSAARGGERLPVAVTARIMMDALAGLHAAHVLTSASGAPLHLVHRDLSPHNLLVGADGIARITDFGVAKAQVRLSSTRDGQFKGKLSYMAPEQAASGQADQRSDLFSIGIVLWESLTGRRLFRGENNGDVLNKILNPQVPKPSQLDPALAPFDVVTATALALDPNDRFQTADEFLEAVEEAASAMGGAGTPRLVAKTVQRWLGDKVEAEKVRIRDAIDALGRNELKPGVLPRPMESGSQPGLSTTGTSGISTASGARVRTGLSPASGEDATMGALPSNLQRDEPDSNRMLVMALVLLSLFVVGGGVGAWAAWPDTATPAAVEATSPPTEPSTVVAQPPVAQPPIAQPPIAQPPIAQPPVEEPAEPAETTLAEPAETTPAADEPEAEGDRSRRERRRRRRERRERAEESPTAVPPTPATGGSGGDDELMLNPYRR